MLCFFFNEYFYVRLSMQTIWNSILYVQVSLTDDVSDAPQVAVMETDMVWEQHLHCLCPSPAPPAGRREGCVTAGAGWGPLEPPFVSRGPRAWSPQAVGGPLWSL